VACRAGGGPRGLLCAKIVTVPALSLFRVREYGVGLGDLGKPLGGIRVMGVHVWMGGSRERVELSGRAKSIDCLWGWDGDRVHTF